MRCFTLDSLDVYMTMYHISLLVLEYDIFTTRFSFFNKSKHYRVLNYLGSFSFWNFSLSLSTRHQI
ncbi:hypothetical protein KFK09_012266 [Dendrobium nobile]|uniref:Uncharacterized protein n=1 Tax=Dendrobium nobile TaxID=94219 RepID=A0A8T3BF12_DENNO|nr:hypothetical protein KFK09_012266 [Dendrobium nobile]